ncbi:MAG: ABC transporter ATP-binding protein [Pseudomonadota bacterium]
MAQIELNGIYKSFGDTRVLDGVDLHVSEGEFVTLVGPSGCGKSTLLRILAGLEAASNGQVIIGGRDATSVRPADRNLAMVFQSYALYPHLTVAQNMMTPLKMRDLSRFQRLPLIGPLASRAQYRDLTEQVRKAARVLKIEPLLDRKPGQLSGGQRQRAALGRALVRNPVAFLMDEPLSNLDAALRVHMRAELAELHRRLGTTFVYVTHDQAEALTMSDRMAVMLGGKILQIGPPSEIYQNPQSVEVARFVGSPPINILPGEVSPTGTLEVLGETLGTTEARQSVVQVGLRPEHISIGTHGPIVKIVNRENLGSDIYLHGKLAEEDLRVVFRVSPGTQAQINTHVHLNFDASKALVFDGDGHRCRFFATALEGVA